MKTKSEYISIRKAAEEIGVNRMWLHGHLVGLGIPLIRAGNSIAISRAALRQIKKSPKTQSISA